MKESTNRESSHSTFVIMGCTFISRILGFVRSALIAFLFGGSGQADVLNTVFSIPNNLRKLFAEGALSSAFIPELSSLIVNDKSGSKAMDLTRKIIGIQMLILPPLVLIATIFAPQVMSIFIQFEDPAKTLLAEKLFRFLIWYIILISISAVMMAVLNSNKKFFIPAIAPPIFSVCVIASLILFYNKIGIMAMAVGVLTGGAAQIMLQFPGFSRLKYSLLPSFKFNTPEFRRVMKQWLPVLITSSIFTINSQIAILIASKMPDGSSSALANAIVFWQLPFGLFSASITTVLFPKMSRQTAAGDFTGVSDTVQHGYRSLISLLLPSAFFLMFMGSKIVAVAFQRGAFTVDMTAATGRVLFAYATGIVMVGLYNFTQRIFYSRKEYFISALSAGIVCTIDVILSLFFYLRGYAVEGLAYANSISFTVGFFILFFVMRKRVGFPYVKKTLLTVGKVLLSLIPAAAFLYSSSRWILGSDWWQVGSSFKTFGYLAFEGLVGCLFVLLCFVLLKVEVLDIFFRGRGKK